MIGMPMRSIGGCAGLVDEPIASELTAEAFAIAWRQRAPVRDEGPQSGARWLLASPATLWVPRTRCRLVPVAAGTIGG